MNTFDPWPIISTLLPEQQEALNLTPLQRLQVEFAYDMHARESEVTTGFEVLQAASRCAGAGIPMPEWLATKFCSRFQTVASFATASLDSPDAFGPRPRLPTGAQQLRTAHLRYRWADMLRVLFSGPNGFPRTEDGYKRAAALLDMSAKQVRSSLPKTRKNVRGHKPYRYEATGLAAHDPFALVGKKRPKR